MESVKAEIKETVLKEQNAFKEGDCDTLMELMSDDITFFANGRQIPSKDMIGDFCRRIPRPFQGLAEEELNVYALSETSGYVVRKLEFPKDESTIVKEVTTKIWRKVDGEWKMQHLTSTINQVPKN